jgi:hypothetical protein
MRGPRSTYPASFVPSGGGYIQTAPDSGPIIAGLSIQTGVNPVPTVGLQVHRQRTGFGSFDSGAMIYPDLLVCRRRRWEAEVDREARHG